MNSFKVALQAYSVRDEMERDFDGTLSAVAKMGYDGIEFAGLFGMSPGRIREICAENKLIPVSAHVPYEGLTGIPDIFSIYKEIGCEYIAIPGTPNTYPGTVEFDRFIENLAKISDKARENGLQFCYHNHFIEFFKHRDTTGLEYIFDSIESIQCELDAGWTELSGNNPSDFLRKYSGRVELLHLKDYCGALENHALKGITGGEFEFRAVGYGLLQVGEILSAAKLCGTKWLICEQDMPTPGKSPLECAALSVNYLKSL